MSWPDMLTSDGEPELPLRAAAAAIAAGRFCADCLKLGNRCLGERCPDHRGLT